MARVVAEFVGITDDYRIIYKIICLGMGRNILMADKKDPFTFRERMGIRILIIMLKIVSPWQYSHEFTKQVEELEKMVREA